MTSSPYPRVDASFAERLAQRRPTAFEHGLTGDPRLSLEAIALLGDDLGPAAVSAEEAVKPLVSADPGAAARRAESASVGDQIRGLAANDAWFTLLNIENAPAYRHLVDQVVDGIAAGAGIDPRDLRRRMGFVFASSPGSVTAAHFDIEHSFLLQLEGRRTLGFGRFRDRDDREREVHRYWNGSFGRLESMPEPVEDIEIGPGQGAYIPPYTPHWLTNGDSTSLSLTVTFFTRDNEDESLVQAFNERVRRLRIVPRTYGDAPRRDRAKVAFMRAYRAGKRGLGIADTSASH